MIPLIKIRSNPPEIIVLTNYSLSVYRRRCKELGVAQFYDKTSELHKVVAFIKDRVFDLLRPEAFGDPLADGNAQMGLG